MAKSKAKKVLTDADVKKKAVKLVLMHLKRKVTREYLGIENLREWIANMEELLKKEEFNLAEYIEMRRELNDIIERTLDEEIRFKLRDSWYSMGRALDKKVQQR